MKMTRSNPVYPVADVAASIAWYRRVLGFEPRVVNPPGDDRPRVAPERYLPPRELDAHRAHLIVIFKDYVKTGTYRPNACSSS
jgi:catechol 2,3-dioxygenase-like lactoylglutathione lyase family enzyme